MVVKTTISGNKNNGLPVNICGKTSTLVNYAYAKAFAGLALNLSFTSPLTDLILTKVTEM